MNKYLKLALIFVFGLTIIGMAMISCSKNETPDYNVKLREYPVQYSADLDSIDKYLNTHYIASVDADFNITFAKIPTGGTQLSIRAQQNYPLQFINVQNNTHGVNYKIYYLKLREGINESTTSVDSIYVSYKGTLLKNTQFDYSDTPVWFQLENVVAGWGEIIPLFKTGTYDTAPGPNPSTFSNFGAGVMFLPSGMAYYNQMPSSLISPYSPLIFSFKLKSQKSRDHDRDRILSKDEVNPAIANQKPKDYDSDGDGTANYLDVDDDGDRYMTKVELLRPYLRGANNVLTPNGYFPFNGAAVDNPLTPNIDERQGVPRKFTGPNNPANNLPTPLPSDYTDPTRLRRYLDPTSFPPFE
jgi:FKBP-type peptidyl-prolyl cis-trans isomerase FkpA